MEEMWRVEGVSRAERSIILERDEDAMVALGNNVVDKKYEDLPRPAQEAAKKDVFNIMGCMLAGTWMPGCKELIAYIKEEGGREESTIINYGDKVPALNAALANGTFARNWDQDDCNIL